MESSILFLSGIVIYAIVGFMIPDDRADIGFILYYLSMLLYIITGMIFLVVT
jgi:uncharacterized membrane protein SirB2